MNTGKRPNLFECKHKEGMTRMEREVYHTDAQVAANAGHFKMPLVPLSKSIESTSNHSNQHDQGKTSRKRIDKQINKFMNAQEDLNINTYRIYKGILNDYCYFTPKVSHLKFNEFMSHTFPNECFIQNEEMFLKSNAVKYCNVIVRFLKFYKEDIHISIHKQYYNKVPAKSLMVKPKIDKSVVLDIFHSLVTKGLVEDALNIHLMFTLWIDPYDLFVLRFDDIQDNNNFKWWNYRTSSFQHCKLTEILNTELKFLRTFIARKYGPLRKLTRVSLDRTKISGNFIVQITPTAIYNRFSRGFSGNFKDFKYTPKDFVDCSKYVYSNFMKDSSRRKLYGIGT